jgi:hypothetical protein
MNRLGLVKRGFLEALGFRFGRTRSFSSVLQVNRGAIAGQHSSLLLVALQGFMRCKSVVLSLSFSHSYSSTVLDPTFFEARLALLTMLITPAYFLKLSSSDLDTHWISEIDLRSVFLLFQLPLRMMRIIKYLDSFEILVPLVETRELTG